MTMQQRVTRAITSEEQAGVAAAAGDPPAPEPPGAPGEPQDLPRPRGGDQKRTKGP